MAKSTSITVPKPRKLPSGSWFIQLRLDGESTPVTANTEEECINTAIQIKAAHKAGKRVAKPKGGEKTLTQAIDDYIISRSKTISPATIRGYRTIQNNFFQSVMDKKIGSIKDWQSIVNADTHAPKGKKNAWHFICSVLRKNSIEPPKITLEQVVPKDLPYLSNKQIKVFVKAAKEKPVEIPALLALHSLRRSEIMALTWDKIDLENKVITVQGAAVFDEDQKLVQKDANKNTSSTRKIRIMIPALIDALKAVPEEERDGLIVTCNPNTIWARVNRLCKENDLPNVGVHGLRRSFASLGYHLKMSELEIMEMGGWSDWQTMRKIYTKLEQDDRIKGQNKMEKFFKS